MAAVSANDAPNADSSPEDPDRESGRDPLGSLRRWHADLSNLAARGEAGAGPARALADAIWDRAGRFEFADPDLRARFFNGLGALLGSPGPAADLDRARRCFSIALAIWRDAGDARARALHNLGSALAGIGSSASDVREAIEAFDSALEWRTGEREIARAVTLHNLGTARAKLARLDPEAFRGHVEAAAEALEAALEIRERIALSTGAARTRLQLGLVRKLAGDDPSADALLESAARDLDALGWPEEAERARAARRLSEGAPSPPERSRP